MHRFAARKFGVTSFLIAGMLLTLIPTHYLSISVQAAPEGTGMYPDSAYETCELSHPAAGLTGVGIGAVRGVGFGGPLGAAIGAAIGGVIGVIGGYPVEDHCLNKLEPVTKLFIAAYDEVAAVGINPGVPNSRIEDFGHGMLIQKFTLGNLGNGYGAILMHKDSGTAFYVGGGSWVAYKRAMTEESVIGDTIFPGHPTSFEQEWSGVRIQFFEGGSWGNGAIIGGDQAWLVTGNHWERYWNEKGWNSLGKPQGAVFRNADGKYQQNFDKGNITELAGQTWVNLNQSTQSSETLTTPPELPPAGSTIAPIESSPGDQETTASESRQESVAPNPTTAPAEKVDACETGPVLYISHFYAATSDPLYQGDSTELWFGLDNIGCETYKTTGIQIYQISPLGHKTLFFDSGYVDLQPDGSYNGSAYLYLEHEGNYTFFLDTYSLDGSSYGFSTSGYSNAIDVYVNGRGGADLYLTQFYETGSGNYSIGETTTVTLYLENRGSGTYSAKQLFIMHGIPGQPSEYALWSDPFEIPPGTGMTFSVDVTFTTTGEHSFWFETYGQGGELTEWTDASGTGNQLYISVSDPGAMNWQHKQLPAMSAAGHRSHSISLRVFQRIDTYYPCRVDVIAHWKCKGHLLPLLTAHSGSEIVCIMIRATSSIQD